MTIPLCFEGQNSRQIFHGFFFQISPSLLQCFGHIFGDLRSQKSLGERREFPEKMWCKCLLVSLYYQGQNSRQIFRGSFSRAYHLCSGMLGLMLGDLRSERSFGIMVLSHNALNDKFYKSFRQSFHGPL